MISIEGYKPDFIAGYEIEEYDLSLEAGRNAKGTMRLNYIPYTGESKTISAYRGDRKVSMLFDIDCVGKLYDAVSQSLIEL